MNIEEIRWGMIFANPFVEWATNRAINRYLDTEGIPDFTIGRRDNPQVLRWYVIPRNPILNIYLHIFKRSDSDFALHDHPWTWNWSKVLQGKYRELYVDPLDAQDFGLEYAACHLKPSERILSQGQTMFRNGKSPHRIELLDDEQGRPIEAVTLFITGPKVPRFIRQWGFYCPKGFVVFNKIVKYRNKQGSEPLDGCP